MIKRQKAPVFVRLTVSGEITEIPQFLNEQKFTAADTGWFYDMTKRSAVIKYKEPEGDYELLVSYEEFDLIGM